MTATSIKQKLKFTTSLWKCKITLTRFKIWDTCIFRTELSILVHCVIKGARIAKRTRYPILAGFLGRVWIAATTRMQTFILQKGRTEARKSGQKSLQKHFAMYVLFLFFKRKKSLFSSSLNLLKLFHCSAQVFLTF